jgi:hypothetical protein
MLNLVKISRRLTLAGAAVAVVGFGLLSDSPANAEMESEFASAGATSRKKGGESTKRGSSPF